VKRGTTEHPKFRRLCRRLGLRQFEAAGILEMLWHFAAKVARSGNIGRWTDEDIAEAIGWESRPASDLVHALVEEGWLDAHSEHRLLVHDWSEHADDAVHLALARAGEFFADGTKPKTSRLAREERERVEEMYQAYGRRRRAHNKRTASARRGVSLPEPSPSPPEPEEGREASPSSADADSPPSETSPKEENYTGEDLAEWWNEMVSISEGSFPKVTLPLSPDRRRKADLRIRAQPAPVEFFGDVLNKLKKSPFCRGQNERGWKMNFDWLIANGSNAQKVLEGRYD
jgi:hypothetical protein